MTYQPIFRKHQLPMPPALYTLHYDEIKAVVGIDVRERNHIVKVLKARGDKQATGTGFTHSSSSV